MKYKRNQYTEGASICGFIIAGAFLWWGVSTLIPYNGLWDWWGFILLAIGLAILAGNIAAIANKGRLRNAVKYEFEAHPNASVDNISQNTGITKKDVQAIILDLKMRGQLRGNFSSKTGELKTIPVESSTPEKPVGKFCPHCGTSVKKSEAAFCSVCGAKFD
jgi:hypothetical protein